MTAKKFPAQQMCCLLVNWSTDRFEYIFLNYYQCHKDWRRRRWTVRANTRQLMMKLMTKIKIDVDTAVHSVLKCFTLEKRRNATWNCTTAMRQKERCRSLLPTTMSILALSVVSTLPARLMRWCTLTFATKYTTLTCASAFFCDNLWCNWLECTKHFDVTLFFEDERLEEAHRVVLAA